MKFIISILFLCLLFGAQAQKSKVSLSTSFVGIEEGYDHDNKYEIYVDDYLIMTTPVQKYSEPINVKFKTKRGNHTLKLVHYTMYEGNWEITSQDNNYSLNCTVEKNIQFGKKMKIEVINDLDNPPVPTVKVN